MRSMTEGADTRSPLTERPLTSPSDAFGATSPWRGRNDHF